MGSACSRKNSDEEPPSGVSSPHLPHGGTPTARSRLALRPPAQRNPDGTFTAPPLVELCVRCIAQHLQSFEAPLWLPAEISGRVVAHCVSRAWLDLSALRCLASSPLHVLELPGVAHLDKEWMPTVCAHQELVRLDLSGAPSLTDAAAAPIAKLPSLRELNLSGCTQLGDATLHHIGTVRSLQLLKLDALPRVTDAGVTQLERLTALQWLSLAGCVGLKEAAASSIAKLGAASLTSLSLQKCPAMDDACVGHLVGSLRGLKTLKLGWCFRVSSAAIGSLGALARLTSLDLAHTKLDDASLAALAAALPRLRGLDLRGCSLSERGLAPCRVLSRMEVLNLRTCEVGDGVSDALLGMPLLRELDLAYTNFNDAGLAALRPLTRLSRSPSTRAASQRPACRAWRRSAG